MTKQEILDWVKQHKRIDGSFEYDENGNKWGQTIHQVGEDFFAVEWCNDHPSEKWGDKGMIRGFYDPTKVKKHVKLVEHVTYIPE